MKHRFLLFFLPLFAFATVNEPLVLSWYSGYRNDRIRWHLKNGRDQVTLSELFRDVEFWENGLTLKTIHRDLVFSLTGSFAFLGRGDLFQTFENLSYTSLTPTFTFQTRGWAADMLGFFGYAINLTAERVYKVILIPLVGYSAHFERLSAHSPTPNPYLSSNAIGASSFSLSGTLPKQLRITWYGVLVGGEFLIQPVSPLEFRGGYSYHRLYHRMKGQTETTLILGSNAAQTTWTKIQAKDGSNMGQSGWFQLNYRFSVIWKLGIGTQLHYYSSHLLKAKEEVQTTTVANIEEQYKMRWTAISGWMVLSRAL